MVRIFLDANILFTSAHNPGGKSALLVELSKENLFELVTCSFAIEEAEKNLLKKYPEKMKNLEMDLKLIKTVPTSIGASCPIPLPLKDIPIFLSALNARSSYLLTGDIKDFGPFMNRPSITHGMIIQTVSEFLRTFKP